MVVGEQRHVRRPHDVQHREIGFVTQRGDPTGRRAQRVGDRDGVGHRPLDDLADGAARLILGERAAALGHERVGVEHTMIVAP